MGQPKALQEILLVEFNKMTSRSANFILGSESILGTLLQIIVLYIVQVYITFLLCLTDMKS